MSSTYDDPKRRAEIDLLFLDIELRIAQIRESQVKVAQIAASTTLTDTENRLAYRRFLIAALGAAAALIAAGGGLFAAGSVIWKPATPIVIHVDR